MPSQIRLKRISDRIKQDLSAMLITQISDPRLEGIFITDVKVDRELAFADIYVSAVEGKSRSAEILAGLDHAKSFIRHNLTEKIELRVFPHLRFHWDPTPENADHIERLLQSLHTSSTPPVPTDDHEQPNP
jgi:ribosome-binding factor A